MFENIKDTFFARLKSESEKVIDADRKQFWPIFAKAIEAIKRKDIYLDEPEYGEKEIKWENMALYSQYPEEDAVYLLKYLCDAGFKELTLNTYIPNENYNFSYDTRTIIEFYKIHTDAPCKTIDDVRLYPFMLRQIELSYRLIDMKYFGETLTTLTNFFENDKNINNIKLDEEKEPGKNAREIRKLLLEYLTENEYYLLEDGEAADFITLKDIGSTHAEIKEYLEKHMTIEIIYKRVPLNITNRRLEKFGFFLAKNNEFLFNVYNLGTYTLFPYREGNVAQPIVVCFIRLANMWISYSIDKPVRRSDFESYKKNIAQVIVAKSKYAGTYIDETIQKKIKLVQINVSNRTRTCEK